MKELKIDGDLRNAFYHPENALSQDQIRFINDHSVMMGKFTKEEERKMAKTVALLFKCAANRKNTNW